MQGLVIFDVDGTLARTSQVDDDCWLQAAKDILGLADMETDWGAYEHSTDEAIASQLIRDRTDLADNHETIERVRRRHDELTHAAVDADPSLFQATPGAEGVFDRLAEDGWASAIATGGWKGTATLKLVRAGIDLEGVPAAFAQDARPRETSYALLGIELRRRMESLSSVWSTWAMVHGMCELRPCSA